MDNTRKERFWTGKVVTAGHANMILSRLVGALGIIAALMAFTFIGGADSSEIAAVVIFAALALVLKVTKSPVVAMIALVLTALPALLSVAVGLASIGDGMIAIALLGLAWGILPLACYRAFVATRVLRKLPHESVEDTFA